VFPPIAVERWGWSLEAHPGDAGNDLRQLSDKGTESGHVPARSSETGNNSAAHRVTKCRHDNRNGAGCLLIPASQ
jgi:hypothetical protein